VDPWPSFDDTTRYQSLALCHYGMAQRWLVVSSQAACERADATLKNATQREHEAITKPLFHLQAKRFGTPHAAHNALAVLAQRWKYPQGASSQLTEHTRYAGKGRPTPRPPLTGLAWHIQGQVRSADKTLAQDKHAKACSLLGTNIDASELSDFLSRRCLSKSPTALQGDSW
jgi:hypothetical protein